MGPAYVNQITFGGGGQLSNILSCSCSMTHKNLQPIPDRTAS